MLTGILAPLALLLPFSPSPQTETPDTVAVFDGNGKVVISTNGEGSRTITFSKTLTDGRMRSSSYSVNSPSHPAFFDGETTPVWDITRLFARRATPRRKSRVVTTGFVGIYAGGLIPTGSHGSVTGGWEIGVNNILMGEWIPGPGLPSLSVGAGLGWEMQTVGHGAVLDASNGILTTIPVAAGLHDSQSKIKRFHFTVPVTLTIPIYRKFKTALSAELHLNTYTTASTSYTDGEGRRTSLNFKGLHQRIATVDVTAAIGFSESIGVYVSYSPMKPWLDGYGPQYRNISVGATLNF